ncbi:MAG: hypothetical protein GY940_03735 [bacterium]|nr:hypothetical protein [bacterium]
MKNRNRNYYMFLIFAGVLVVLMSFYLKPLGPDHENPQQTGEKSVKKWKFKGKAKSDTPIQEDEPFVPYQGRVVIEQDLGPTSVNNGTATALDGMDHDEIAEYRFERVSRYKELGLFPAQYHPFKRYNNLLWGSAVPGEKWTGPTVYYIANPYVIIGMAPAVWAVALNHFCPDVSIVYENGVFEEVHKGDSARCWFDKIYQSNDYPGKFRPKMVNAWDAGFFYIYVDRSKSLNIKRSFKNDNITNGVSTALSYFHYGGYNANSLSPMIPNHWLTLQERYVNTRIYVKLWRNKPNSHDDPADLVYITRILIKPDLDLNAEPGLKDKREKK